MGDDLLIQESWSNLVRRIHPSFKKIRKSSNILKVEVPSDFFVVDSCTNCEKSLDPCVGFCEEDHRYCEQCLVDLRECIICTKIIRNSRQLSRVCFKSNVYYPCWNVYRGCTTVVKRHLIEEHERTCIYGFVRCPFKGSCRWMGNDKDLFAHLQQHHPIINADDNKYDVFFYHKRTSRYFRLTAFLDHGRKGLRFYVTYVGPEEEARRYWFRIRAWNLDGSSDNYKFEGICKSLSTNMLLNNCHLYQLVIPFDIVPNYISNGQLKVDVRIDKIPKDCIM